jgi:hypothetical protein
MCIALRRQAAHTFNKSRSTDEGAQAGYGETMKVRRRDGKGPEYEVISHEDYYIAY